MMETPLIALKTKLVQIAPSADICSIELCSGAIVLDAPNTDVLDKVLENWLELQSFCHGLDKDLMIKCAGGLINISRKSSVRIFKPPGLLPVPLIEEMPDSTRPIAIVTMDADVLIYITSGLIDRGGKPASLGTCIRRWHLTEELHKLRVALDRHGQLTEYQYRAVNLDLHPVTNSINAWLVDWQGTPVRVVELLHQQAG